ncbi:hypothetical protein Airi02_104340 [Actinoallomurus iriomotensis]|uniref:Uncharacterized protein n=1 Tax=Actinoallomurus iriomotensis TaxID=478107 RepID=A0A9W6SFA6_9ACTN|nr:hypothetical protein Airi02_104340 [Actinoallomurus iriomotensis]
MKTETTRVLPSGAVPRATALNVSPGARAYYDRLRARDVNHSAALRQVANRLVGILHGCLEAGTVYDETTLVASPEAARGLNS